MSSLDAVMAGALLALTFVDGCYGYCWWSSLAVRPVVLWTILTCKRWSSPTIIIFVPREQVVLFHQRSYSLLRGLRAE